VPPPELLGQQLSLSAGFLELAGLLQLEELQVPLLGHWQELISGLPLAVCC
jgi:hypothetical protein